MLIDLEEYNKKLADYLGKLMGWPEKEILMFINNFNEDRKRKEQ